MIDIGKETYGKVAQVFGDFWILATKHMPGARKVSDPKLVSESWKKILSWPSGTVMTYHDPAGVVYSGNGQEEPSHIVKMLKQVQ